MSKGKYCRIELTNSKLIPAALTLVLCPVHSSAHGGGTDSYDCHNQTSTGTYHCHSGPFAGQSFSSKTAMLAAANAGTQTPAPTPTPSDAYNRDDYLPSWADADGNCIDTRHEVLITESLVSPTMSANGCSVVAGLWFDPYTALHFTDPADLDVDHVVPLKEAHDSGAAE